MRVCVYVYVGAYKKQIKWHLNIKFGKNIFSDDVYVYFCMIW